MYVAEDGEDDGDALGLALALPAAGRTAIVVLLQVTDVSSVKASGSSEAVVFSLRATACTTPLPPAEISDLPLVKFVGYPEKRGVVDVAPFADAKANHNVSSVAQFVGFKAAESGAVLVPVVSADASGAVLACCPLIKYVV